MKFIRDTHKFLHLGRNNTFQLYKMEVYSLKERIAL